MFKKISLDNNIPLLLEATKELRSVCIGIWVKVGSRYEKENKNGISHFLEHMYFKGTEGRSARDIAIESDSLGGELNAFTSTEYTLFYIKVLNEYIEKAADLLTDIFLNATFPESDIEKEKNIVLEEIKMVEDNPGDYVHDLFSKNIWGEEGLGQSILGSKETIDSFTRKDLSEHIEQHYGTNDIVVACSGNFQEDELVGYLNRTMGQLKREGGHVVKQTPHYRGGVNIITKEMSESHICLGLRGLPYVSDQRYVLHLLNTILGSGFSSRLFQNIRENRGLAYSIYSFHSAFFDTGLWSVYAGTDRSHVSEVVNTDDIPLLVSHYLKKISISNDKRINGVSSPALQVLEHYNWPGNVRQLVNSLEHAAITCKTDTVDVSDLPDYLFEEENADNNKPLAEKEKIRDALTMFKGNRTLAAKHLGISRVTLWKRIKDYNITV
jgi:predicted Zn-dependent peptidase